MALIMPLPASYGTDHRPPCQTPTSDAHNCTTLPVEESSPAESEEDTKEGILLEPSSHRQLILDNRRLIQMVQNASAMQEIQFLRLQAMACGSLCHCDECHRNTARSLDVSIRETIAQIDRLQRELDTSTARWPSRTTHFWEPWAHPERQANRRLELRRLSTKDESYTEAVRSTKNPNRWTECELPPPPSQRPFHVPIHISDMQQLLAQRRGNLPASNLPLSNRSPLLSANHSQPSSPEPSTLFAPLAAAINRGQLVTEVAPPNFPY